MSCSLARNVCVVKRGWTGPVLWSGPAGNGVGAHLHGRINRTCGEYGVCYHSACHLLLLLTTHCVMPAGLLAGAVDSDVRADSIIVAAASNHSFLASLVALPSMRGQLWLCTLSTPSCSVAGTRLLSVNCNLYTWLQWGEVVVTATTGVHCALWCVR